MSDGIYAEVSECGGTALDYLFGNWLIRVKTPRTIHGAYGGAWTVAGAKRKASRMVRRERRRYMVHGEQKREFTVHA